MSAPVDVGTEVAALHFYLATAERLDHDAALMLGAIAQHGDAHHGSAVDDAWVWTLNAQRNQGIAAMAEALSQACPYCCAEVGQECREDCATRWDEGTP